MEKRRKREKERKERSSELVSKDAEDIRNTMRTLWVKCPRLYLNQSAPSGFANFSSLAGHLQDRTITCCETSSEISVPDNH